MGVVKNAAADLAGEAEQVTGAVLGNEKLAEHGRRKRVQAQARELEEEDDDNDLSESGS
jgi:uncharacterized protein YjbJ (UPF0337 family)